MSNTRVSKKGTVTVQYPKAVVADAALEAAVHALATKRSAAKELSNDADGIKKDIEAEYWDGVTETRPIIDAEGVMLAEIKTINSSSTKFAEFVKHFRELLPAVASLIEEDPESKAAWDEAVAKATTESTYCKVLTK